MTFKNNFIVEVKCDGRIMRIRDDVITLPFGSEYSVYMKNLNSRKAVASLTIDGKDALDGHHRIIMPNASITINGFMKGLKSINKFKFTKKTKRISKYRGDFPDDGILRVEFWFEKVEEELSKPMFDVISPWQRDIKSYPYFGTGDFNSFNTTYTCCNSSDSSFTISNTKSAEGITVKGSKIDEDFVYGDVNSLEKTSNVISIKLRGYNQKKTKKIKQPIYTNTRLICEFCGTKSKSFAKYCMHCGNSLE